MKRIFIAIRIDPQSELLEAYDDLKERLEGEKIKWVEEDNFHLTINFIGEKPENDVKKIIQALETVSAKFAPFKLRIKGLGTFGKRDNPNIVFTKIVGADDLFELSEAVKKSLLKIGIRGNNKPLKPHLTLGRIKSMVSISDFYELIEVNEDVHFQNVIVNEFILYESILKPDGPEYIPLGIFRLG